MSVVRLFATYRPHAFPGAALRDQLTAHWDEEALWRCGTSERFSPLFLSGFQPAANLHRWNRTRCHLFFFFFCRVPNRRQQTCSRLYPVKRPCLLQRTRVRCEDPFSCGSLASTKKTSRKRRCAQTDLIPGVRGYLGEKWTSEWTASKQPLIRGWRWDNLSVGRRNQEYIRTRVCNTTHWDLARRNFK